MLYVYLDDVIIYNKDAESHLETLEEVLSRVKNEGLKAKLTKCEFLKERLSFPGHQIGHAGIPVKNYHETQSADKGRSFLG